MGRYYFDNVSPAYLRIRDELREAEIALMEQRERVAELRRSLPREEAIPEDYVLREGPRDLGAGDAPVVERKLSELFDDPAKPLVLLHFMFGGAQESPCPMCTLWADGYDNLVPHLEQRVNFAVVVAGDVATFRAYARERGWRHVRILSSEGSSLKRDLFFEEADGSQWPGVSIFERDAEGRVHHFYSGGARLSPEHFRGMDLLSPFWSFLDLTPDGRGDFMPKKSYA
jgi:predicted dithiol-disulfide oxidoreductase (DUF899 family)